MEAHYRRTIWKLDPRWIRIEALDDRGQSLGVVRFEPNADFREPAPSRKVAGLTAMRARLADRFAAIFGGLRASHDATPASDPMSAATRFDSPRA